MIIGGFQRFTLTDFPGRVAAVLFTQGCNFRCPFCHNGELIPREPAHGALFSTEEIIDFFRLRQKQLDGAVITGGEPTIHPDLPALCREIRELGMEIKLDTNGSNPVMLNRIIGSGLVDFIAMDIKAPFNTYQHLAGTGISTDIISESIRIIAASGVSHLFRTTLVKPLLDYDDMQAIKDMVPAGSRHVFQEFRKEKVLDPALLKLN